MLSPEMAVLESDERFSTALAGRLERGLSNFAGSLERGLTTIHRQHLAKSGTFTRRNTSPTSQDADDTAQALARERTGQVARDGLGRDGLVRDSSTGTGQALIDDLCSLLQATQEESNTLQWFLKSTGVKVQDDFHFVLEGDDDKEIRGPDGTYHGEFDKPVFRKKFLLIVEFVKANGSIHGKTFPEIRIATAKPATRSFSIPSGQSLALPSGQSLQPPVEPDQALWCTRGTPRRGKTMETIGRLAVSEHKKNATKAKPDALLLLAGMAANMSPAKMPAKQDGKESKLPVVEAGKESRQGMSRAEQATADSLKSGDQTTVDGMD